MVAWITSDRNQVTKSICEYIQFLVWIFLIILMQKSSQNLRQAERDNPGSADSKGQLSPKGQQPPQTQKSQKSRVSNTTIAVGAVGALGLLYLITVVIPSDLQVDGLQMSQFKFPVFCPISKFGTPSGFQLYGEANTTFGVPANELRRLTEEFASKASPGVEQYLVYVQMRRTSQSADSSVLAYCSYVADWSDRNCSNAKPLCSFPGPIFYVERNQPIEVAWVYNINSTGKNFSNIYGFDCYNSSLNDQNIPMCYIEERKPGYEYCTYLDPTDLLPANTFTRTFRISTNNIPMVSHIHGLEVRPSFDGNPLAWLGKNGKVGMGFTTILNNSYYSHFKNPVTSSLLLDSTIPYIYAKVNRYQNFQAPGNLWYHDHSMHSTQANVALGMAGDYIIHDPEIDSKLPQNDYEILIVAGQNFNQINSSRKDTTPRVHGIRVNPNIPFAVDTNLTFKRNQTYRIRILNGQYDSTFLNLQFRANCNAGSISVNNCPKKLSFSVIGSDSCLFDKPVRADALNISSAERYEILIVFDGNLNGADCDMRPDSQPNCENTINPNANKILLVSQDRNAVVHNIFDLEPRNRIPNNFNKLPSQVSEIGGPFYDLNPINQTCSELTTPITNPTRCLSVIRMRPFFRDVNFAFFFNGHYHFSESGASDNPKIGTTEDWYFINTMSFGHPIHVHLINYQIISKTTLKYFTYQKDPQTTVQCTFYEMDFYIDAGVVAKDKNLSKVCQQVRALDIKKVGQDLKDKYLEDTTNGPNDPVSGLDARLEIVSAEDQEWYNQSASCQSNFKYICEEFSNKDVPAYERKWKEVAYVDRYTAMQVRIRWTSTEYDDSADPNNPPYPYFQVPEDELIEHPGYVYHCHFLQHEDDELMRSFMMQPSDKFADHYPVAGTPLGNCMAEKGLKNEDGWKARYQCINKLTGCPAA